MQSPEGPTLMTSTIQDSTPNASPGAATPLDRAIRRSSIRPDQGESHSSGEPSVQHAGQATVKLQRVTLPSGAVTWRTVTDGPGTNGLIGLAAGAVVDAFDVSDLVGTTARVAVAKWENANRPSHLRRFDTETYRTSEDVDIESPDLSPGRWLVFVHGTFATGPAAFAATPVDVMERLQHGYENRIVSFEHPTLSESPAANAETLVRALCERQISDVDLICHSRGGLVAAELMKLEGLAVHRVGLIGSPLAGTPLASASKLGNMLDRLTTILNLVPAGPADLVIDVLVAILEAVKVTAVGALSELPGLSAMDPSADTSFDIPTEAAGFAMASDYEPKDSFGRVMQDLAVDKTFEDEPNDLIVPVNCAVPPEGSPLRKIVLKRSDAIRHSDYFGTPEFAEEMGRWTA